MKADAIHTQESVRRPYTAPVVTTFGSISKLTQSGTGTRAEGASGKSGKNG